MQALVLTDIVIGPTVTALLLALMLQVHSGAAPWIRRICGRCTIVCNATAAAGRALSR
jgi:hypothetical protein